MIDSKKELVCQFLKTPSNLTDYKIAKKVGCTRQYISFVRRQIGLPLKVHRKEELKTKILQIDNLKYKTAERIGQIIGLGKRRVQKFCHSEKIPYLKMKPGKKKYSDKTMKIISLCDERRSSKEIASIVGVSRSRVCTVAREHRLLLPDGRFKNGWY